MKKDITITVNVHFDTDVYSASDTYAMAIGWRSPNASQKHSKLIDNVKLTGRWKIVWVEDIDQSTKPGCHLFIEVAELDKNVGETIDYLGHTVKSHVIGTETWVSEDQFTITERVIPSVVEYINDIHSENTDVIIDDDDVFAPGFLMHWNVTVEGHSNNSNPIIKVADKTIEVINVDQYMHDCSSMYCYGLFVINRYNDHPLMYNISTASFVDQDEIDRIVQQRIEDEETKTEERRTKIKEQKEERARQKKKRNGYRADASGTSNIAIGFHAGSIDQFDESIHEEGYSTVVEVSTDATEEQPTVEVTVSDKTEIEPLFPLNDILDDSSPEIIDNNDDLLNALTKDILK